MAKTSGPSYYTGLNPTEPATVYSNYCMLSQTKKVKPVKAVMAWEEVIQ